MAEQVFFRHEKVYQHVVEQLRVATRGIVLDDDAFQFGQAFFELRVVVVMLMGQLVDVHVRTGFHALHQIGHIRMDMLVFVIHVAPDFRSELVVKLQDEKCNLVACRTVYRFYQFAPDGRQTELHKVIMGTAKVVHQCRERQRLHNIGQIRRPPVGTYEIHHCQKSGGIYSRRQTGFAHRMVAKP